MNQKCSFWTVEIVANRIQNPHTFPVLCLIQKNAHKKNKNNHPGSDPMNGSISEKEHIPQIITRLYTSRFGFIRHHIQTDCLFTFVHGLSVCASHNTQIHHYGTNPIYVHNTDDRQENCVYFESMLVMNMYSIFRCNHITTDLRL